MMPTNLLPVCCYCVANVLLMCCQVTEISKEDATKQLLEEAEPMFRSCYAQVKQHISKKIVTHEQHICNTQKEPMFRSG